MSLSRTRRREGADYWPGFVDALSTLVIAIVFMLSVFVLAQFFIGQEITGKDTALRRLENQVIELTDLLSLERSQKRSAEENLALLQSTLNQAEGERRRLQGLADSGAGAAGAAQSRAQQLQGALDAERQLSQRAQSAVELLNQQISAMRRQLAALEDALSASEARDTESQTRIADLGSRLNIALAQRVQELARYRSDFFGRMRQILGNRPDIRVVGDRFVFQSEIFFDAGAAALKPEGQGELDKLAAVLNDIAREIPPDIPWIVRVDGHTDVRPIRTPQFPSNWHLSTARAVSVVEYLATRGLPAERLAATGFGEFQPLELGTGDEAFRRNRRIEFKITER
ncbi:MAG: peptidoglycan -binding protein [Bosea sp.]|jgi:chemotaxis protein MotB|nr:peptidoglycan -binding protein [Bosea sp. (in: a-proteobacteria)]